MSKNVKVHDFKYAYERSQKVISDGVEIKVVSVDDLILLKKAAVKGRVKLRYREDLDFLLKLKKRNH